MRSDLLLNKTLLPGILEEVYDILLGWLLVLHKAIKSKERRDGFPIALERRVSVHLWAQAEPQMVSPEPQVLARSGCSDSGPKPPEPRDPYQTRKEVFLPEQPLANLLQEHIHQLVAVLALSQHLPAIWTPSHHICRCREGAGVQTTSLSSPWEHSGHHYLRTCSSQAVA